MKIITIVGARPQFIKAAMVSQAIQSQNINNPHKHIQELILHTGQHYDDNMSQIFFSELNIPRPVWQLHCGNHTHGAMTGQMLIEIEQILLAEKPDYVLVYGDTNSTLAGALAASKLLIPVIHVEAGLRSFNKTMPEELNRILTDHISTLLCCPTTAAVNNLSNEGIHKGVHHVGDVMYDAALLFGELADKNSTIMKDLHLNDRSFLLCTVHRAENTDHSERLQQIIEALFLIATKTCPIIFPLHPRTHQYLEKYNLLSKIQKHPSIHLTAPLSFIDMGMLEKHAATILTDSGGVQKEAYFHHTPCITLRQETEWIETVEAGWNQIAGYQTKSILSCLQTQKEKVNIQEYGDGKSSEKIIGLL